MQLFWNGMDTVQDFATTTTTTTTTDMKRWKRLVSLLAPFLNDEFLVIIYYTFQIKRTKFRVTGIISLEKRSMLLGRDVDFNRLPSFLTFQKLDNEWGAATFDNSGPKKKKKERWKIPDKCCCIHISLHVSYGYYYSYKNGFFVRHVDVVLRMKPTLYSVFRKYSHSRTHLLNIGLWYLSVRVLATAGSSLVEGSHTGFELNLNTWDILHQYFQSLSLSLGLL